MKKSQYLEYSQKIQSDSLRNFRKKFEKFLNQLANQAFSLPTLFV